MFERLNEYEHKCLVLKQIQSNKALMYKRINNVQNFLTVVISALITFIGFSGMENIKEYIHLLFPNVTIAKDSIEMAYNLSVFLLFIITICHLVFQFNDKQSSAEKAIWLLSSLINEIHDVKENIRATPSPEYLESIGNRYNVITQVIPSNTDREYKKARKHLKNKPATQKAYSSMNLILLSDKEKEDYIVNLIEKSTLIQEILKVLRTQNRDLYLGGGVIRNLVWDSLHGYKLMTPLDDVDIVYYDGQHTNKSDDIMIEEQLRKSLPNIKWSVKNQARMHVHNGDAAYSSLEDAIAKWPETVSAMAVKLSADGSYEFIAPYQYDDLFRMIIRPTPHFMSKLDRYQERAKNKDWKTHWQKLELLYLDDFCAGKSNP